MWPAMNAMKGAQSATGAGQLQPVIRESFVACRQRWCDSRVSVCLYGGMDASN
jgi:hypothetical protein